MNVVVEKLTMSSNEMLSWNDAIVCDGVEGVIQSVTELCVSEDSNKKPASEVLPNSVPEHKEIVNDATQAMPNSVAQQGISSMELQKQCQILLQSRGKSSMKLQKQCQI